MKNAFLTLTLALIAAASYGAITATSDDFSSNTNTFPSWISVGAVSTTIEHDSVSAGDYDDGDLTQVLPYSPGMTLTGDGVKDDGGLKINSQDGILGNEAAGLTIGGTMEEGEVLTFSGSLYNDGTSYYRQNAQLWNLTDNVLLSESGNITVQPGNKDIYVPVEFNVIYTAQDSDEGDTLQIRFLEDADNTARDIYVDNFSLTAVPQPPGTLIAINFDGDGGPGTVLAANTVEWNYTAGAAYDMNSVDENTLAFNGRSTSTDYIIRDKGTGHEATLFFKTIDTASPNFGVYLLNMDFTFEGANSAQAVRVNWSFDILGYNQNGALNPSNWTVKVNSGNNNPVVALADDPSAALAQTFDFIADTTGETALDGTWTTITGSSTVIPRGAAGTNGFIQISTDNGGYTSSGGIYLDNISVSVTNVPPKVKILILSN